LPFFFFHAPTNRVFSDVEKAVSDVEHLARLRMHGNKANVTEAVYKSRLVPLYTYVQPQFSGTTYLVVRFTRAGLSCCD
jgi:hypothetical protein